MRAAAVPRARVRARLERSGADRPDRLERGGEHLDELLRACADAARQAVEQIRAGALEPSPDSCAYTGGCAHPTICRCVTS